jgi:hypothetical protein
MSTPKREYQSYQGHLLTIETDDSGKVSVLIAGILGSFTTVQKAKDRIDEERKQAQQMPPLAEPDNDEEEQHQRHR